MDDMPELLSDDQITEELASRSNWRAEGKALRRTVELPSFPAAIEAVDKIAEIAEELDHHPDIDIRWRTLHFKLTTHSAGGITTNDITLADRVDAVIAEY
jgi:4a-hydroxytetrahydrobiopterin dehydratase